MIDNGKRLRRVAAVVGALAVLWTAFAVPVSAQELPGTSEQTPDAAGVPPIGSGTVTSKAAPTPGSGFAAGGQWLVPGTVSLDWDDIISASGYELMWRSEQGWALLSERESANGVAVEFDGSSALVGGLPEHLGEYWFSVRARTVYGVSQWSLSFQVAVPLIGVAPVETGSEGFSSPRGEVVFGVGGSG